MVIHYFSISWLIDWLSNCFSCTCINWLIVQLIIKHHILYTIDHSSQDFSKLLHISFLFWRFVINEPPYLLRKLLSDSLLAEQQRPLMLQHPSAHSETAKAEIRLFKTCKKNKEFRFTFKTWWKCKFTVHWFVFSSCDSSHKLHQSTFHF